MTMSFAAERLRHPKDTDDLESTKYLSKSISIINEYLADPSMRASDSTIATVACLANIEVSIPSFWNKSFGLTYSASQRNNRERSNSHQWLANDDRTPRGPPQPRVSGYHTQDGALVLPPLHNSPPSCLLIFKTPGPTSAAPHVHVPHHASLRFISN